MDQSYALIEAKQGKFHRNTFAVCVSKRGGGGGGGKARAFRVFSAQSGVHTKR